MGEVVRIDSREQFNSLLSSTKDKLIVCDFKAVWCGPCKQIAPVFTKLAAENPDVLFLQADVDEQEEVAKQEDIEAMPTFKFYLNEANTYTLKGANPTLLTNLIKNLKPKTQAQ